MGIGGIVILVLLAAIVGYILVTEKPFSKKSAGSQSPFEGLPKISIQLVKAPEDMTERLTPKWQRELCQKLEQEGYVLIGDYSYASTLFFWARTYISPDQKSALLLVNWVEGKEGGKVVISNLEIYSFTGNSFIVTACAQDGAAKLLTGANRPSEEQMSLHLKAVYAEIAVRPILEEHQQRLKAWEEKGTKVRELTKENVLPSLSKIFS
ncbi:MAG TPA: hypothetical protein VJ873_12550 [bacterium]|nr:hypothetical protein [bacterium]